MDDWPQKPDNPQQCAQTPLKLFFVTGEPLSVVWYSVVSIVSVVWLSVVGKQDFHLGQGENWVTR